MRNIFLFIRRYFNLLLFLFLQVFSIYLIVHYSRYHNAIFSSASNQLTGKVNKQFSRVEYYFQLKKTNDSLVKANAKLYNKLKADFELPDTTAKVFIDSLKVDSIEGYRKYRYYPAKVVYNSVAAQNNYLVLSRGLAQQVKIGMGVIDPNSGVVGVITDVSKDFAVVMSLLHKDSRISGKLLKGGETGTLNWDGKTPNIISLTGIAKSAKVAKGDTIISSGFSTSFPRGMMVGSVLEAIPEKSSSNYLIKFRSAANFYNLEYVYVIENKQAENIKDMLDNVKNKNQ
ncbi:MAG: rod shape-determining protein MreC [Ferruginibacter sp.]|nr:rod shape-determining protein MreC [Chitinophagaceae bacterium]MBP6285505.1 rod shape-determining protein MreC [Ferruginibacter sp.]MBU9936798.1 rod shape-determining protein MreC [Ferruginibacter sp.]HQY10641.1 rod shape-determining protein MreC [Ferruginibacter sp.]